MKRSPLRRVSRKRQAENKIYRKKRILFLSNHPHCAIRPLWTGNVTRGGFQCPNDAVDVHHTRGRTGRYFLDARTWLAVCRSCHRFLHDNPAFARKHGYIKT